MNPQDLSPSAPSSIVVSLEMAKKLKKAGWPQDKFLFVWNGAYHPDKSEHVNWLSRKKVGKDWAEAETFTAPTAEEILRRLPEESQAAMEKGERKRWVVSSPLAR